MKLMHALVAAFCALAATPVAAATSRTCADEVREVVLATFTSGPYEVTASMTSLMGHHLSLSQVVPGEGMHSRITIGDIEAETLIRGDRFYRREGDAWVEGKSQASAFYTHAMSPAIAEALDFLQRPRCLGYRLVNGRRLAAYSFGADSPDISTDTLIYVNPATGRPARAVTTMVIAGDKSEAVADYRYDASIMLPTP